MAKTEVKKTKVPKAEKRLMKASEDFEVDAKEVAMAKKAIESQIKINEEGAVVNASDAIATDANELSHRSLKAKKHKQKQNKDRKKSKAAELREKLEVIKAQLKDSRKAINAAEKKHKKKNDVEEEGSADSDDSLTQSESGDEDREDGADDFDTVFDFCTFQDDHYHGVHHLFSSMCNGLFGDFNSTEVVDAMCAQKNVGSVVLSDPSDPASVVGYSSILSCEQYKNVEGMQQFKTELIKLALANSTPSAFDKFQELTKDKQSAILFRGMASNLPQTLRVPLVTTLADDLEYTCDPANKCPANIRKYYDYSFLYFFDRLLLNCDDIPARANKVQEKGSLEFKAKFAMKEKLMELAKAALHADPKDLDALEAKEENVPAVDLSALLTYANEFSLMKTGRTIEVRANTDQRKTQEQKQKELEFSKANKGKKMKVKPIVLNEVFVVGAIHWKKFIPATLMLKKLQEQQQPQQQQ